MDKFSTFDVERILRLKRTRLQEWLDFRYITPSIQKAEGRGTKAIFSREDLYRISLFRRLLDLGLTREEAHKHACISFKEVGSGEKDIKYSFLKAGPIKSDQNSGMLIGGKPTSHLSEIDFDDDDTFLLIINMVAIKREVDNLVKG